MTDDPRDPLDAAIARDLHALAPTDVDVDAALGSLRPALHRARTRHRLALSGGALGMIVVVAGVGAVLTGRSPGHLNVTSHATTVPVASSTTRESTTTSRPEVPVSPSTPTTKPFGSPKPPGGTPIGPTGVISTPTSQGRHGESGPGTTSPTSGTPTSGSPTTTPAAPSSTKTYTATGGRVTVTFADGRLTLDSYAATAGYRSDVHTNQPDDVEVRFSSDKHESRIRIRVRDGRLTKEITES